jgi:hypothetical protein
MSETRKIDDGDLAYLVSIRRQVESAQILMTGFMNLIADKYKLKTGDQIQPDGTIITVPSTVTPISHAASALAEQ